MAPYSGACGRGCAPVPYFLYGGEDCLSAASSAAHATGTGAKAPGGPRPGANGFGSFCRNKRASSCGGDTPHKKLCYVCYVFTMPAMHCYELLCLLCFLLCHAMILLCSAKQADLASPLPIHNPKFTIHNAFGVIPPPSPLPPRQASFDYTPFDCAQDRQGRLSPTWGEGETRRG